ncbi:hypothetical protein EMIHUDRAFT_212099 [Emiliania huxleyi CCMP1516]|uniref:SRPBCC domain-containing protein n=2 Tax=Emiliania huxleyi TaxID=2903 RepID=A0A0D3IS67_EMIH1|nr:hypothetical protein EMIHUDRAFT_212099 [Emiliania huxleyi CCMP1516]EOD14102.1 hypothetical protein EMIHUDRAFT_212099 [Emiliania huxleyi CCMP1516]|eukprot:XP_005766531.1 hypothetical protein EMIHUDRAFT_212099 [Emiliania huxleyi CCMP1516]
MQPIIFSPDKAKEALYDYWNVAGRSEHLPSSMRGVFWFNDNQAPELLICFEGCECDAEKREVYLPCYGPRVWPWCHDYAGWGFRMAMSDIGRCSITFRFDENWEHAEMPLYFFGCIPLPTLLVRFTFRRLDERGDRWERLVYSFGQLRYSYTLTRIIDEDGAELQPSYGEMIANANAPGIVNNPGKTWTQVMAVDGPGSACLPGVGVLWASLVEAVRKCLPGAPEPAGAPMV